MALDDRMKYPDKTDGTWFGIGYMIAHKVKPIMRAGVNTLVIEYQAICNKRLLYREDDLVNAGWLQNFQTEYCKRCWA